MSRSLVKCSRLSSLESYIGAPARRRLVLYGASKNYLSSLTNNRSETLDVELFWSPGQLGTGALGKTGLAKLRTLCANQTAMRPARVRCGPKVGKLLACAFLIRMLHLIPIVPESPKGARWMQAKRFLHEEPTCSLLSMLACRHLIRPTPTRGAWPMGRSNFNQKLDRAITTAAHSGGFRRWVMQYIKQPRAARP